MRVRRAAAEDVDPGQRPFEEEAARRVMPRQKPSDSIQNYSTPADFVAAVERRFGRIDVDLAASARNTKAPVFVSKEEDAFQVHWHARYRNKRCWLNPPFGRIAPWAEKCAREGGNEAFGSGTILLLMPASVGANWFGDWVHGRALVVALRGWLSFDGVAPYPKDCILSVFGPLVAPGFEVWDWRRP